MRKTLLFFVACIGLMGTGWAQFLPGNNQAFQFLPLYNPAFSGVEDFGDLKLSYRYQWTGFSDDAPKFINLSYNMRLRHPLDLTQNSMRTGNSSMMMPESLPKAKGTILGLGLNAFNIVNGQVERIGGGFNFSVNQAISRKLRLAGGISFQIDNTKINLDKLIFREPDAFYQSLISNGTSKTEINLRAGILLYGKGFYFGFSYLPVWVSALKSDYTSTAETFYIASAQTGVSLTLNPSFQLKPSVLVLLNKKGELQIDYNLKAFLQNKFWIGASYRDVQSGVAMAGFNVTEAFSVSYSFEFSTSGLKQYSDGSHEVVAAIRLNNLKRLSQYTW